jgi:hypothetical protein
MLPEWKKSIFLVDESEDDEEAAVNGTYLLENAHGETRDSGTSHSLA